MPPSNSIRSIIDSPPPRSPSQIPAKREGSDTEDRDAPNKRHDHHQPSSPLNARMTSPESRLRKELEDAQKNVYLARVRNWTHGGEPDESRAAALEEIECWFDDPMQVLDLSEFGLTHLPELPEGLTSLNVSKNRLTSLPELPASLIELEAGDNRLSALPALPRNLIDLFINGNQIVQLSDPLPQRLIRLYVGENRLESLPPLPASLRGLFAYDNLLRSLPDALPPSMLSLDVMNNFLTELPDSIARLPAECDVSVGGNRLSADVVDRISAVLAQAVLDDPLRGPRINFWGDAEEIPCGPLDEEVMTWFSECADRSIDRGDTWRAFAIASPASADALSEQLVRLRTTAQYLHDPRSMVLRVVAALHYIGNHRDVLEMCGAIAVEGTERCDDRVALAFIEIEEAVINHKAMTLNLDQSKLIAVGGAMFRSALLKQSVLEKARSAGAGADFSEIVLRYWIALSGPSELNLPSKMNAMLYADYAACVSAADIDLARRSVSLRSMSAEKYEFLGAWNPWRNHLQAHYPEAFQKAIDLIESEKNALQIELNSLETSALPTASGPESEFAEVSLQRSFEIGAMMGRFNRIEPMIFASLTREIIEGA